jgi:putative tricarboxylic transport membrane protein
VPGGALAMQQLKSVAGNAHWLGTFHTGAIAGAVTGLIKADPREFMPVAMMVEETSLVAVRADSPLKTGSDLVAALKADPTRLRIAVAPALGQNTHMAIAKPLQVAGVAIDKLTIAPFRSSGESVTALIGGHVDVVSATAPVILPQVAAGKLRVLASAAAEPGTGRWPRCKTWRQQGVPADYVSYNGVMLPPGANAEQIRFWEEALRKVSQDRRWLDLVEKSGNKPIFRGYVDSHRYLHGRVAGHHRPGAGARPEGGPMTAAWLTAAGARRRMGGRTGRTAGPAPARWPWAAPRRWPASRPAAA